MPRSVVLLIVLVAGGVLLGVALSRRPLVKPAAPTGPSASAPSPAPAPAPDLDGAASAISVLAPPNAGPAGASVPASPQMKVLQDQVSYLEEQVRALQKENSELIDKLASLTRKPDGKLPAPPAPMSSAPCDPGSTTPPVEEPDFVGIGIELVKLRGIQDIPIPTTTISRADVEKLIAKWLATQVAPDHGRLQGRALAALGAIPEPVDTIALKAGFLSHQIGGWYDPAEQTLFLARQEEGSISADGKENALALSYGSLFKRFASTLYPRNAKVVTLDARLSRDSLISGDAALMRFLHAVQNPNKGGGGGVGEDPDDPSRAIPIPNFLREIELLPFVAGFDFMQAMHSIGEWEQVDATYTRPPIAGAEVLESRVYLNETPFVLQPIDFADVAVKGKAPFWQDRLGPMATVVLLKQRVPAPMAADTAAGWANDRLMAYDAGGDTRGHVVWQTLWRDSNAADAYFSAMRQWLLVRYKGATPAAGAPAGVLQLEHGGRFVQLQRTNGNKGVIFLDAADGDFLKEAATKFVK